MPYCETFVTVVTPGTGHDMGHMLRLLKPHIETNHPSENPTSY